MQCCLFCFDCTVHSIDCSPGPKYHIDAKLTRFGRDGTPAYSIHGRVENRGKSVIQCVILLKRLVIYWSTDPLHVETTRKHLAGLSLTVPYPCCIWQLQQEPSPPLDQEHTALRKPLCAAPIANHRPTPWAAALSIAPWTPCPPPTNTPSLLSWAPTSWPKHPVPVTPSLGEVQPRTYPRLQVLVDITAQIPVSTSRGSLRSPCWADTLLRGSPHLYQVLEVITQRKWQCTSPDLLLSL